MSLFREHYIGGLISYPVFFAVSMTATLIGKFAFGMPIDWNPTIAIEIPSIVFCFAISLLSSLLPDVDIKSKSQQIIYRIFILINLFLIVNDHYIESAIFGLFAMLPMIGKHRGWTHSRLTMLILPLIFVAMPIYLNRGEIDTANLISETNLKIVRENVPFYIASVIGYATHLHLDGLLIRWKRRKKMKK